MAELGYARELYYRHSNRTPPGRVVLALALTVPAAALIGALYAVLAYNIPRLRDMFVVVGAAVALLAAFAFSVAGVTAWLLRLAKVRTVAPAAWVSVCAAGAAWYGSWLAWEWLVLRRLGYDPPLIKLLIPTTTWYVARMINETGTLAYGSPRKPINGALLWAVWAVEAAAVWFVASIFPPRWNRGAALCDACGAWCDYRQGFLSVGYGDEQELRAGLENKDLSTLESLGAADMDAPRRLRVDLQQCRKCDQSYLLSVFRIDSSILETGHRSEKATLVVDRLWLDPAQAQSLREIKDRLWPPIAEVAEAGDEGGWDDDEDDVDDGRPAAARETDVR